MLKNSCCSKYMCKKSIDELMSHAIIMTTKLKKIKKANTPSYSVDAVKFIKEVEKQRFIWDLNSEGNRYNSKTKQAAWEEVANVLIPEFKGLAEGDKVEIYRKLYSKWRNIRDAYARSEKRKNTENSYMYAKHLTFLKEQYSQCNSENSSDENNDKSSVEIINTYESEEDVPLTDNLKHRRISARRNLVFVEANSKTLGEDVECEDKSFFDSLLPAVRGFDLDQKLEFRCEVLRLIKKIRCEANGCKLETTSNYFE